MDNMDIEPLNTETVPYSEKNTVLRNEEYYLDIAPGQFSIPLNNVYAEDSKFLEECVWKETWRFLNQPQTSKTAWGAPRLWLHQPTYEIC